MKSVLYFGRKRSKKHEIRDETKKQSKKKMLSRKVILRLWWNRNKRTTVHGNAKRVRKWHHIPNLTRCCVWPNFCWRNPQQLGLFQNRYITFETLISGTLVYWPMLEQDPSDHPTHWPRWSASGFQQGFWTDRKNFQQQLRDTNHSEDCCHSAVNTSGIPSSGLVSR